MMVFLTIVGRKEMLPLEPGQLDGFESRAYRSGRERTVKKALEIMEVCLSIAKNILWSFLQMLSDDYKMGSYIHAFILRSLAIVAVIFPLVFWYGSVLWSAGSCLTSSSDQYYSYCYSCFCSCLCSCPCSCPCSYDHDHSFAMISRAIWSLFINRQVLVSTFETGNSPWTDHDCFCSDLVMLCSIAHRILVKPVSFSCWRQKFSIQEMQQECSIFIVRISMLRAKRLLQALWRGSFRRLGSTFCHQVCAMMSSKIFAELLMHESKHQIVHSSNACRIHLHLKGNIFKLMITYTLQLANEYSHEVPECWHGL